MHVKTKYAFDNFWYDHYIPKNPLFGSKIIEEQNIVFFRGGINQLFPYRILILFSLENNMVVFSQASILLTNKKTQTDEIIPLSKEFVEEKFFDLKNFRDKIFVPFEKRLSNKKFVTSFIKKIQDFVDNYQKNQKKSVGGDSRYINTSCSIICKMGAFSKTRNN